jgi:hypothetical protein
MFNRFCFGALLLVGLAGLITGCSTTSSPTSLTTIVISPSGAAAVTATLVPEGVPQAHAQFTAIGYYGHAGHQVTKDITDQVTWSSSLTQVVGICSNGSPAPCTPAMDGLATVTGFTSTGAWTGFSQITASAPGFNGMITSNSATFTVTACTGCSGGSSDIVSVKVVPDTQTVTTLGSVQYEAIGTDSNGSTYVLTTLPGIQWASSNLSVAKFADPTSGVVTTIGAGTTTITATFLNQDKTGAAGSGVLTVAPTTVTGAAEPITSMSVTPGSQTASSAGQTIDFLAIATTGTGTTVNLTGQGATINNQVVAPAVWISSDQSVATIDKATGIATTKGPGATVITATATNPIDGSQVIGQANLTVSGTATSSAEPLVSLAITPASQTSLTTGTNANVHFIAIGTTSAATTVNLTDQSYTLPGTTPAVIIPQAVWSSSNPAVATIDPATGIATPKNTGATAITAIVTNPTDNSIVTAVAAYSVSSSTTEEPLLSMSIVPGSATAPVGLSTQLLAFGTFSASATTPGLQNMVNATGYTVSWYSSNQSVATICSGQLPAPSCTGQPNGLVTGLTAGTTAITAIATNTADKSSVTATAVFTVSGPPTSAISSLNIVPGSQTITMPEIGQTNPTVNMVVIGTNSAGLQSNVTSSVTWSSSNPAVLPSANIVSGANTAVATVIGPGTTTLTATYTNTGVGASVVTQSATLTVTGPAAEPLLSLAIIPGSPSAQFPTQTTQLTAIGTFSQAPVTQDMTSKVTWSSSNPLIATVCNAVATTSPAVPVSCATTPGLVTAKGQGTAAITATTSNTDGSLVYATVPFTVQAGSSEQISALTIVPGALTVSATGQPASLIALGTSAVTGLQEDVTNSPQLAWTSSNQEIATVCTAAVATTPAFCATTPGQVQGVSAGASTVKAEFYNQLPTATTPGVVEAASVTVTVTNTPAAEPLLSISVLPTSITIPDLLGTGQYLAYGTFSTAPTSLDITNGFYHAGFPNATCTGADAAADTAAAAADAAANLPVTNLPFTECSFVPVTWVTTAPYIFPIDSASGATGATGGLVTAEGDGTDDIYAVATNPDSTLVYSSIVTFNCPLVAPTYATITTTAPNGTTTTTTDFTKLLNPGSCNALTIGDSLLSTLTVFNTGVNTSNWLITAPSATGTPDVIHCGGTTEQATQEGSVCTASYPDGTIITLTAPTETGVQFGGWSDTCDPPPFATYTSPNPNPPTLTGPNTCTIQLGGVCTINPYSGTPVCTDSSNVSVGAVFN